MQITSAKNLPQTAFEYLHDIKNSVLKNPIHDLEEKFPNFSRYCNEVCDKYLYDYLTSPLADQNIFTIHQDKLKNLLNISHDYQKFYHYMLDILIKDNQLTINNDILSFESPFHFEWNNSKLQKHYPMFKGTLSLLDHCVSHYKSALSGQIPAISVLYPDGDVTFIENKLNEDIAEYSEIPVIRNIAITLISQISQSSPLRILEIGGGRGIITKELLNNINHNNLIEYHFTDIGRRFVLDMKRSTNNLSFVKCSQFDITKNPIEQGIQPNSYDIILGLDVVHATPNIETTLMNLKSVMKKDGILCLLETTYAQRWQNLMMGLTKGWWLFEDQWRTSTPLVSSNNWKKVIKQCEFNAYDIMTLKNKNSDAALIFAF